MIHGLNLFMRLSALVGLLSITSCGPDDPFEGEVASYFQENSGLSNIELEEGALAGTWAMRLQGFSQQKFPVLGWVDAGGETYYLVERQWDSEGGQYLDRITTCGGDNFEIAGGNGSNIKTENYQKVPVSENIEVGFDHGVGDFSIIELAEGWGFSSNDIANHPFFETWEEALASDDLTDPDGDGLPGLQMEVSGLCDNVVQFVQKRVTNLFGKALNADHIIGLQEQLSRANVVVSAEDTSCAGTDPREKRDSLPVDDPMKNYFEMIRIENPSCEHVLTEISSGNFCNANPFIKPAQSYECEANMARAVDI